MKKIVLFAAATAFIFAAACKKKQEASLTPVEQPAAFNEQSAAPGGFKPCPAGDFAFNLYRKVAAANPGKNVFLSPSSARWALGMAYTGAAGRTRDEMAAALGAKPVAENLKAESELMQSLMAADPKVKLRVANGLWLKNGFPFKQKFVSAVRKYYRAEVFARNFVPADVGEANAWVSRETEGKIPSIINQFKPEDRALLINAVYFKGNWTDQFEKEATKAADFHLSSGKAVRRKMMDNSAKYDYFKGEDFQAVRLPYGNKRLGMVILLPGKSLTLTELNDMLTPAFWDKTLSGMKERSGRVRMPRFKLKFSAALNEPLKTIGMNLAFDKDNADFTEIADTTNPDDRLFISQVLQKTFVEVNEEGTEAAAVTAVGLMVARSVGELPFNFNADHPFLYAITDRVTGDILFLGALYDPN